MKTKSLKRAVPASLLLVMAITAAWAIPGFHVRDDASAKQAVQEYADHSFQFGAVVYQAALDQHLWQLTLSAYDYLQQKPNDPERECSFATAYWDANQIGIKEDVPPDAKKRLQNLYNAAVQAAQDAVQKEPDSVEAHLTYGHYLQYFVPGMQKVPAMLHEFNKAVALRPELGETHLMLGDALWGSGNYTTQNSEHVIAEAQKALTLDHRLTEAYWLIAGAYWQEGKYKKDVEYTNKFVAANPSAATRPDVVAARKGLALKLGG